MEKYFNKNASINYKRTTNKIYLKNVVDIFCELVFISTESNEKKAEDNDRDFLSDFNQNPVIHLPLTNVLCVYQLWHALHL